MIVVSRSPPSPNRSSAATPATAIGSAGVRRRRPPLPTAPKVEPPKQQPQYEADKTLIQGYRDLDVFIRGGGRF